MNIKLVTDSSANITPSSNPHIASAPLRIIVGGQEFVDTENLNVDTMLQALKVHKGPSSTACPGVQDWLDVFGNADIVYGAAITSGLSGCFNAAQIAAEQYMENDPGKKVFILDSLSTGPELELIMEKYQELIEQGLAFDQVCQQIQDYSQRTHLMFSLESLENFAKNGRVSPILAKAVGILGIRVVGRASSKGTLEPQHKVRGEKKAIHQLVKELLNAGYQGGKIRITHTKNPSGAAALANEIRAEYPLADIRIGENRALCSFYAEPGGLLLGFET